jgi:DNA-binding PadR family transcriptional regulator
MRGLLSFLILFLLSKAHMHGQALAEEIGRRKGGAKPSPGTIYPALKGLKKAGLVEEKKEGKTVVYSLTCDGHAALKAAKARFCQIFVGVTE